MSISQSQVSQLYVTVFGRSSEGAGNKYWQQTQESVEGAATAMLATQASRDYFGSNLDSNQAFIEHIYANTLGKTIADDPEGIAFWVNALANGNSRGFIISELISAAQHPINAGAAQDRFNNRVEVSNYVADVIEGAGLDVSDEAAMQVFIDFNTMVTSDPSSVLQAKNAVATTPQTQDIIVSDLQSYDAAGGDYNFILNFSSGQQQVANIDRFGEGDIITLVDAPSGHDYVFAGDSSTSFSFGIAGNDYSSSWAINFQEQGASLINDVEAASSTTAKLGVLESTWGEWIVA